MIYIQERIARNILTEFRLIMHGVLWEMIIFFDDINTGDLDRRLNELTKFTGEGRTKQHFGLILPVQYAQLVWA